MTTSSLQLNKIFADLPPEWPEDPFAVIRESDGRHRECVVVLDDDPTGTQSVHSVPVLTCWSNEALQNELKQQDTFYILTNSRSLSQDDAIDLTRDLTERLVAAARIAEVKLVVMSRTDSTLRGHFPAEVDAISTALGGVDGVLLVPAFIAGGRFTVNDIHFVQQDLALRPVAETEFAKDPYFGFSSSNLRKWVEEKTGRRISAAEVTSISIETIRCEGPVGVCRSLMELHEGQFAVANAVSERDLAVVAGGAVLAESRGKSLLYRTAASFVAHRAAIQPRAFLSPLELELPKFGGGLIVVGSYIDKSSNQLEKLLAMPDLEIVEVSAAALGGPVSEKEIRRVVECISSALEEVRDVVLFTSREVLRSDGASFLSQGKRISHALAEIVRRITIRPRFVITKGGITSSDIAIRGFGIQRATVLGQIQAGVSVWRAREESRWPGLVYVVFPGNVGEPHSLHDLVSSLRASA
jgi:uncharacterized protein YgbK (DUF1537 family)